MSGARLVCLLLLAVQACESFGAANFVSLALSPTVLQRTASVVAGRGALRLSGGGSGVPPLQRTLAIIKPDAVGSGHADEIKKLIVKNGFKIIQEKKITLTKAQAQQFYQEHKGKVFFDDLVNFMTSGPVIVMILQKEDAIKAWRTLMGPTNSNKARSEAPNSIRAKFGSDGSRNASHGSDAVKSATREIGFFFGPGAWLQVKLPFARLFWKK